MATYKSGDIVGKWETGHMESPNIFQPAKWVAETYTWRVRYVPSLNIWLLTASSSLPSAWNNHEVVQSMTNFNEIREHLYPEFLASNLAELLADNADLSAINLKHLEQLSDGDTQDNSTVLDSSTVKKPTTTNTPPPQSFNMTYVWVLVGLVLLVLVIKKFKK
jgi:hypothetical protein